MFFDTWRTVKERDFDPHLKVGHCVLLCKVLRLNKQKVGKFNLKNQLSFLKFTQNFDILLTLKIGH